MSYSHINRSLVRSGSSVNDSDVKILTYLHKCLLKENLVVLSSHISRINQLQILSHLKGAYAILEILLAQVPCKDNEVTQS